ncbi:MAG: hypothetical protein ACR2MF_02710, partial [Chthoniobacterales bacterium]
MRNLTLVAFFSLAVIAPAFAATHKIPDDNPLATVTAPDGWKALTYDQGVELTSDDGEVYIAIEVTEAKSVDKSIDAALAFLKKKGVTVDEKTAKTKENKVGENDAVSISWEGKDEEGVSHIQLIVMSVTKDKG